MLGCEDTAAFLGDSVYCRDRCRSEYDDPEAVDGKVIHAVARGGVRE